jgi:DNA-binding CsgD family transcriptional regulator
VDIPHLLLESWLGINMVLLLLLVIAVLRFAHRAKSRLAKLISHACALFMILVLYGSCLRMESVMADRAISDPFLTWSRMVLTAATSGAALWGLMRLRQALRIVERDQRMVSVLTEQAKLHTTVSEWGLTARELQVVEAIASGVTTDREIANALFIAPTTVATHVSHILHKAGLSSRMDVMLYAGDLADTTVDRAEVDSPRRFLSASSR